MAFSFRTTQASAATLEFMPYLFGKPQLTDRKGESNLLDFSLAPWGTAFKKLNRGAYIKLSRTIYSGTKWFTGYVTNEPELEYLGAANDGTKVFGYKYHATSDEYILSLKPIGVVPSFMNMTMGAILKALVELLVPGVFDTGGVQDGPLVAQYALTPDKKFVDISKDFCDSAAFVFYGLDHKLYFKPKDDSSGVVTINTSDKNFTPSQLTLKPAAGQVINDVTVLGDIEPQAYVSEYFMGTGLDATFPLISSVYGIDRNVLIDEVFSGSTISPQTWVVTDEPTGYLRTSNGYLNILGGTAMAGVNLLSASSISLQGHLKMTHGEWDFLGTGTGLIGALWTGTPSDDFSHCVYGICVDGSALSPVVAGSVDTGNGITLDFTRRYILRTLADFEQAHRTHHRYSYVDKTGTRQEVAADETAVTAHWDTIITEVNPADGTVTNQWRWSHTSGLTTAQLYAAYSPVASRGLHATVTSITVSIPLNARLDTASIVELVNGGLDQWDDAFTPTGWTNTTGINEEKDFVYRGESAKIGAADGTAHMEQDVHALIQPNTQYAILVRLWKGSDVTGGTLRFRLDGSGLSEVGAVFAVDDLGEQFKLYTAVLTTGLSTVPDDCKLVMDLWACSPIGTGIVLVDEISIVGAWQQEIIGPNEIDAMDGMAPVATITGGNTGSDTKSSVTGTPQYNFGQCQLVFFKDSSTLTSDIPPDNQVLRLTYRSAGPAMGRCVDSTSVDTEAASWGDNGVRAQVRTDLSPRPRTSLECEMAAASIVQENSWTHYEGSYTQWSDYFTVEPKAGHVIKFTNASAFAPTLNAEEITEVVTTMESHNPIERLHHVVTFGKPDHIGDLLAKIQSTKGSFQKNAASANPIAVDPSAAGTIFAPDVTRPVLVNWTDTVLNMDAGQDGTFEVRYTDSGWLGGPGKNLIATTSRLFTVPRTERGRVFFIRQVSGGACSRYSAAVHVAFPLSTTNAYSDNGAAADSTDTSGSTVGPCCARFVLASGGSLQVDKETPFAISEVTGTMGYWDAAMKDAPTGSDVVVEFKNKSGATMASIKVPAGSTTLQQGLITPGVGITARSVAGYCRVASVGSTNPGGSLSIKIYIGGSSSSKQLQIGSPSTLTAGTEHTAYSYKFVATGGTTPYTWSVASGSALPTGFTLDSVGNLACSDPTAGVTTFKLSVTDSSGTSGTTVTKQFTLTIKASSTTPPPVLTITDSVLPTAVEHEAWHYKFAAANGVAPYTWTAQSSLPTNFTLLPDGQFYSFNPVTAGGIVTQYAFTVAVTDSNGVSTSKHFSIKVYPKGVLDPLTITSSSPLPDAAQYAPWYYQFQASGGRTDQPYGWALHSGSALPAGYALTVSGVLNCFDPVPGDSSFSVDCIDADGNVVTKAFTLHVSTASALSITTDATLPDATGGEAWNYQLEATGGHPSYTWALSSGSLPTNFTLQPGGVLYSFTPVAGTYTFTLLCTDLNATVVTKAFTLTVA